VYKTIYHASENCPVGCGEVIFLEGLTNKKIFGYCTGCSIAYKHPQEAQFETGLNEIKNIADFSAEGVCYPSLEAIQAAGFGDHITGSHTSAEGYSEEELNDGRV